MLDLLQRCSRTDDFEAWADLYLVVQATVTPAVRRILLRRGFTSTDVEDVFLETMTDLYAGKLWQFRQSTLQQLEVWLRKVASNYARKWAEKQQRARRRESRAFRSLVLRRTHTLTVREVEAVLDEFAAVATGEEIERLRILMGQEPTSVSERTLRQWRVDLEVKLRHHLRELPSPRLPRK
jgi:hypothetical protein